MTRQPVFHLTRRAALDLRDIYERSEREWGEATAIRYMADLYVAMGQAAANPEPGVLRRHRAVPFLMIPARQHFVVYDRIPEGIVVLTVMHQMRDIEGLIAGLAPSFLQEVERLNEKKPTIVKKRPKESGR